jgi:hypothetical protein
MDSKNNEGKINIELPENVADGTYSNLAVITHSNAEFIIDFIRIMPGVPSAKVKSRIILTPQHAKRLLNALKDNIGKYESLHGKIMIDEGFEGIPLSFGGPTPEA